MAFSKHESVVWQMVFKQLRLQRPIHFKVMADKHMCSMIVFVSFINTSQVGFLYFRFICKGTSRQRSGKGAIRKKKDSHSKNRVGKKMN